VSGAGSGEPDRPDVLVRVGLPVGVDVAGQWLR
jgi:hypothetical protein